MKIVIDTNFWIDIFRFRIDFSEISQLTSAKIVTLDSVRNELEKISQKKTRESGFAKLALELIKKKKIKILKTKEKDVDKVLLKIANKKTIIATNDKILRKKLKEKKAKIIYIRGKKHIAID